MPYSTGPFTAGPPHPRDQDRQKGTDLEPDRGAAAAVYPSISSDDTSLRAGEIDIDDQPVGEFVFPESEKYAERLANFPSIEDPARQPPTPAALIRSSAPTTAASWPCRSHRISLQIVSDWFCGRIDRLPTLRAWCRNRARVPTYSSFQAPIDGEADHPHPVLTPPCSRASGIGAGEGRLRMTCSYHASSRLPRRGCFPPWIFCSGNSATCLRADRAWFSPMQLSISSDPAGCRPYPLLLDLDPR